MCSSWQASVVHCHGAEGEGEGRGWALRKDVMPHHNSSQFALIMQFNLEATPVAQAEQQPALDKLGGNLDWHFTPQ